MATETDLSQQDGVPNTAQVKPVASEFFDLTRPLYEVMLDGGKTAQDALIPAARGAPPAEPGGTPLLNFGTTKNFQRDALRLIFTLRRGRSPSTITFIMPLNPQTMTVTKDKVKQWILTNGGFIKQTWGNNIVNFQVQAKTSNLSEELETGPKGSPGIGGIFKTRAYKNFKLLEFFVDYFDGGNEDNRLARVGAPSSVQLKLGDWGGTFEGIVSQFTYSPDSNKPFNIEYGFTFEAVPRLHAPRF